MSNPPDFIAIPGRHLAFTKQQDALIEAIHADFPYTEIVFVLSSANQENCRYNPLSEALRMVQIDRFARSLEIPYRVVSIPHFKRTTPVDFVQKTLKYAKEAGTSLRDDNTLILCSTPPLIEAWETCKFRVHPMELSLPENERVFPINIIQEVAQGTNPSKMYNAHRVTKTFLRDYPQATAEIKRTWNDPLFGEEGNLSQAPRDYNSYAAGMQANILIKAHAILPHIKPGRIVDEGCADGGLLQALQPHLPECDLIGVDGSTEMIARAKEKVRAGAFADTFTHFYCRNFLSRMFEENSIDTTISNSSLHEIYSYNVQDPRVIHAYLEEKLRQLKPGGIFVARDVVAPNHPKSLVNLHLPMNIFDTEETPIAETSLGYRAGLMWHELELAPTSWDYKNPETWRVFKDLPLGAVMECLHKIDYTDNWKAEIFERFCFWTHNQWKEALEQAGFEVLPASHAYAEPWLYENRFTPDRVQIEIAHGSPLHLDRPKEQPITHQILVAKKPL